MCRSNSSPPARLDCNALWTIRDKAEHRFATGDHHEKLRGGRLFCFPSLEVGIVPRAQRTLRLVIRLLPWERDAIHAAASATDRTLSDFVRLTLLAEAQRRVTQLTDANAR